MTTIKFGAGVESAPGIYLREIDQTVSAVANASTESAIAGIFNWGPVNQPLLLSSETQLAETFGKPSNQNAETWFAAANFLSYADKLYVNRVIDTSNTFNAVANTAAVTSMALHAVQNAEDYATKSASFEAGVQFIAKYPGTLANDIKLSICSSVSQYESLIDLRTVGANTLFGNANTKFTAVVGASIGTITLANTAALAANTPLPYASSVAALLTVGDRVDIGNTSIGTQTLKITSIGTPLIANTAGANTGIATIPVTFDQPVKIAADHSSTSFARAWEYRDVVDGAPSTTYSAARAGSSVVDGVHAVVVDASGRVTGRAGAILEVFEGMSRATDAVTIENQGNFFKNVLNTNSRYVWAATTPVSLTTGTNLTVANIATTAPYNVVFAGGTDGLDEGTVSLAVIAAGFSKFANKETFALGSVIVGKTRGGANGEQVFNYVIDNVADIRQDIVVFGSPAKAAVVGNSDPRAASVTFRGGLRRSSYAVIDSGYKYQYDRYNDVFRYVPLCGDIAGLSARTDVTNDPWASIAGYNRGQIKNVVRLSYNPSGADQKVLFSNDINPVVQNATDGTFLLGDKTLLGQNSAFNSIGVRKLFIIVKQAIAKASKSLLFEQNDEFTQSRFKSIVEPLLRDIQGRNGVTNFTVICDDTNNTPPVVAAYQFVGDIYIVPARSIRTIHLNFVATNGVPEFNEIA